MSSKGTRLLLHAEDVTTRCDTNLMRRKGRISWQPFRRRSSGYMLRRLYERTRMALHNSKAGGAIWRQRIRYYENCRTKGSRRKPKRNLIISERRNASAAPSGENCQQRRTTRATRRRKRGRKTKSARRFFGAKSSPECRRDNAKRFERRRTTRSADLAGERQYNRRRRRGPSGGRVLAFGLRAAVGSGPGSKRREDNAIRRQARSARYRRPTPTAAASAAAAAAVGAHTPTPVRPPGRWLKSMLISDRCMTNATHTNEADLAN